MEVYHIMKKIICISSEDMCFSIGFLKYITGRKNSLSLQCIFDSEKSRNYFFCITAHAINFNLNFVYFKISLQNEV